MTLVIVLPLETMESLQIGDAPYFQATPLQSCRTDTRCKRSSIQVLIGVGHGELASGFSLATTITEI